jgi:hypothetical protein
LQRAYLSCVTHFYIINIINIIHDSKSTLSIVNASDISEVSTDFCPFDDSFSTQEGGGLQVWNIVAGAALTDLSIRFCVGFVRLRQGAKIRKR